MIAVAVAASLVTYAWVMGYLGFTTNKVGKAIQVQSVTPNGNVYVQNVGDSNLQISSFYVNGILDPLATASDSTMPTPLTLDGTNLLPVNATETATITWSKGAFTTNPVTVKIVTTDGTSAEFTKTFP
jgi:hypothetical protein